MVFKSEMRITMSIFYRVKEKLMPQQQNPAPVRDTLTIKMMDGSFEDYDRHFMITDGKNCVICKGELYHTSLDCECLAWEMAHCDNMLQGMTIKDAKAQNMIYCNDCSMENYLYRHGRSD